MKNQTKLIAATLLISSLCLQSCATILGGSRDASRVLNGTPSNAKVYYNGNFIGTAPTNVQVPKSARQGNSKIEIQADGYQSATINMTRKVSVGFTILDIVTGGIWLAIDFATGNIYKPRPNKISYNLTPLADNNKVKAPVFKKGEKVIFSKDKFKNIEGEIVAMYPDRALIKFTRKPTLIEKAKGIRADVEDQVEVPFIDIAKK